MTTNEPEIKALTRTEQTLLRDLTQPDAKVSVVIPAEIDSDKFFFTLGAACRAFRQAEAATEKLMPILGRLLLVARENPSLYTNAGYQKYDDFIDMIGSSYGVGRSTCYEARALVDRWGKQIEDVDTFREVGRVKFAIISKVVPKGDEGKASAKKLIEMAKTSTIDELKTHIEEKYHVHRSDMVPGGTIRIECTSKKRQAFIERFLSNPKVHAYCETEDWDKILERMIEECSTEWLARVSEAEGDAGGAE